ncbi:mannitol dehydrogenase family protein [Variovorax sp. J22P271]|uniref:mannitol dehydrogenase family protein n=1 Tax=Variovorax davisae TaxID=3053515 RepID=UPI002577E487|nr:mannitol dehydrogenase family protein [Variovorax sp. J22P271]MDM0032147.1 mannitol dehydrogenase family protein [Variovorax sp. J22P271]
MNQLAQLLSTDARPSRPPMARLTRATLGMTAPQARVPGFGAGPLRPGILHLGCGSFHRAHQALLTQRAVEWEHSAARRLQRSEPPAWGIVAASLVTRKTIDALAAQDGLYTLLERGPERTHATVVGSICELVYAPDRPEFLKRVFADPAIRVVTLTITVAGYCADAANRLDATLASVQHDLHVQPSTAIGLLVQGLRKRWIDGAAPPVILSCDNLPANGRLLRQMCLDFAALHGEDRLASWIATHVQFPCTVVDRIVPVTSAADRMDASASLGLIDTVPVCAEPFYQWVIERFDGARPRWDAAGAEYVSNVEPWEASKLRLLNGGHLAIASLGKMAGCATVADAMAVPGISAFALRFMLDEQKPTLPASDHDIDAYARQLLARWRSRGVVHQLDRVARGASTKLPGRLLASLRDNLCAGRPAPCTVLAVAAWMCCVAGRDDAGQPVSLVDAMCAELKRQAADAVNDPVQLVALMLAQPRIFGDDLPRDSGLRRSLQEAVAMLQQQGVRGAVAACMAGLLP